MTAPRWLGTPQERMARRLGYSTGWALGHVLLALRSLVAAQALIAILLLALLVAKTGGWLPWSWGWVLFPVWGGIAAVVVLARIGAWVTEPWRLLRLGGLVFDLAIVGGLVLAWLALLGRL